MRDIHNHENGFYAITFGKEYFILSIKQTERLCDWKLIKVKFVLGLSAGKYNYR